jgi:hypothetical protein
MSPVIEHPEYGTLDQVPAAGVPLGNIEMSIYSQEHGKMTLLGVFNIVSR